MRSLLLLFMAFFLMFPDSSEAFDLFSKIPFAKKQQVDVIATVNGQPITLHQLEVLNDLEGNFLAQNPSLELLQKQYGFALTTLIVHALVMQDLQKRGITITDDEVSVEEATIRADYPPEIFETMLQEEYLDLQTWREILRQRLALKIFREKVLRPRLSFSQEEMEAEYKARDDLVKQPEKVEFFWFQNTDKKILEEQRNAWINEQNKADSELVRIPIARLSILFQKDLTALTPSKASPIRQEGETYHFFVLQQRLPAHTLSLLESWMLLEESLVEKKLDTAYSAWLDEVLPKSKITIASKLLH